MKKFSGEMRALLDELNASVQPAAAQTAETGTETQREKLYTVPEPFNLSVSKSTKERPVTPIYKAEYKAKPPPANLRANSLEQVARVRAEKKQESIQQTLAKYTAGIKPFDLETAKRPERYTNMIVLCALSIPGEPSFMNTFLLRLKQLCNRPKVVEEPAPTLPKRMPPPQYPEVAPAKRTTAQILRVSLLATRLYV